MTKDCCQEKHILAIFDRDDTLLVDRHYMHDPADIEWIDGAIDTIRLLREHGFKVCVATNQSGIARGYFSESQMHTFHQAMQDQLNLAGTTLDGFYHCPHHPEGLVPKYTKVCRCRKPEPGLVEQINRDFPLDMEKSFLIGDKPRDVQSAEKFGIRGFLFEGGSLHDLVGKILKAQETG